MKTALYSFAIVFFLLTGTINAQNLVPNPSFELCNPQCSLDDNNNTFDIQNWKRPNANSSDIYSTLLPSTCQMYMPGTANYTSTSPGEQLPRTGNVLGGFVNEARLWNPRNVVYGYPHPYREYFQPLCRMP